MSAFFDHSPLPLWVFIVIIVVGFVVVTCTVAVLLRCWVIRRRSAENASDTQPMRRVTVRRGRVVPADHYLSLTGSRFGLNQFEDNDTIKTRNRSPFGWLNSITEKKSSSQDNVSQLEQGSTRSRSNSVAHALYGRREFASSALSVSSEKELKPSAQEIPEEPKIPPQTAEVPVRLASFSRPFVPRTPTTPLTHIRNLSRIEEASPHVSMISTRSGQRRSSHLSGLSNMAVIEQPRLSRGSSTQFPPTPTSIGSFNYASPQAGVDVPRPIAYRGSRSSLGDREPSQHALSHRSSSTLSRRDSVQDNTDISKRGSKKALSKDENQDYWRTRQDLKPVRSLSKKGNVLRKKSLKRAHIVAMVDA